MGALTPIHTSRHYLKFVEKLFYKSLVQQTNNKQTNNQEGTDKPQCCQTSSLSYYRRWMHKGWRGNCPPPLQCFQLLLCPRGAYAAYVIIFLFSGCFSSAESYWVSWKRERRDKTGRVMFCVCLCSSLWYARPFSWHTRCLALSDWASEWSPHWQQQCFTRWFSIIPNSRAKWLNIIA